MIQISRQTDEAISLNTSAPPADIPLAELPVNTEAIIVDVDCSNDTGRRLMEMGCTPGAPIQVRRSGSPLIIRCCASTLALDKKSAGHIRVSPLQ